MSRTYLKVPFPQKDAAKSLGAKWDATIGSWYVPETLDLAPFAPWLSGSLSTALATPVPGRSTALADPSRATTALTVGKFTAELTRIKGLASFRLRNRCQMPAGACQAGISSDAWLRRAFLGPCQPLEFMQRLAALEPRPRLHLIRFHSS